LLWYTGATGIGGVYDPAPGTPNQSAYPTQALIYMEFNNLVDLVRTAAQSGHKAQTG